LRLLVKFVRRPLFAASPDAPWRQFIIGELVCG
jgi:hypothetical protein